MAAAISRKLERTTQVERGATRGSRATNCSGASEWHHATSVSASRFNHASQPTRSAASIHSRHMVKSNRVRPNVGVDAAGSNCVTGKLSMTSPLIPLASNDLFDGGPTSRVTRQRIQVAPAFKQPRNQVGSVATSFNLAAARSGASCRTSNARRPAGN